MNTIILTIHVVVSVLLIVLILMQSGKGAGIGATFGGGNQTQFGSSRGSLIGKTTAGAAFVFMLTSMTLAYFSSASSTSSIMDDIAAPVVEMQSEAPLEQVPSSSNSEQTTTASEDDR